MPNWLKKISPWVEIRCGFEKSNFFGIWGIFRPFRPILSEKAKRKIKKKIKKKSKKNHFLKQCQIG
jgi:hypothetical protein